MLVARPLLGAIWSHGFQRPQRSLLADDFRHMLLLISLTTSFVLLLSVLFSSSGIAATEKRGVVFELDPPRNYPDIEKTILSAITIDGFIGNSGHRLHLPGELVLDYDPSLVKPGGTVPLTFTFNPKDGAGLEYDLERGVAFNIDAIVWDWGFKYGDDFEEDFIPPVGSGQTRDATDQTVEIWGKSLRCVGGISFGLFTRETFEGRSVRVPLRISQPGGGVLVTFVESGTDTYTLQFTGPGATATATLDISLLFLSRDITVVAEDPRFLLNQTQAFFEPGVEGWVVNPKWPNLCNQNSATTTLKWITWPGGGINRSIPMDPAESDGLAFRFKSKLWPFATPMVQDLRVDAFRTSVFDEPALGEADSIVTVIRNVSGDLCSGYDQIQLDYSVVDGGIVLPIGSLNLSPGDPGLDAFNAGIVDSIAVVFEYSDASPNYIHDGTHLWQDPNPSYRVAMTATPAPPCVDWELGDEPPALFDNDVRGVPYALPLPDFAIDSLVVDSPPYVQFGDTLTFDVRVTNRGVLWPPPQMVGPPTIVVDARVSYERRLAGPPATWSEILWEYAGQQVLTPMSSDQEKQYTFQYIVPLQQDVQSSLPLDRVRITFEVQDGSLPLGPLTWDRNYENNTLSTDVFITDYPDLSLASPQSYANGDSIQPSLPYFCGGILPTCSKPMSLYVNDTTLDYSLPNIDPPNLRVWLGTGPFESSPSDPGWTWTPVKYQRDFYDNNNVAYKVFRTDLCWLNITTSGKKSYAFRSSLDFSDDHPTYAYVDQDGISTVRGQENVYFMNNAGVIDWPCHTVINGPSVIGVGMPAIFDGIGSTGSDNGPIVQYNWDFGDSTAESGETVFHVYSEPGNYVVKLCTLDFPGIEQCATSTINVVIGTATDPTTAIPTRVALYPARPNPFNPSTSLSFDVPRTSEVEILIANARGRRVRRLVQRSYDAGTYSVVWDGRDDSGRRVQSGVYYVRLAVGSVVRSESVVLLK